ncbi:hypothetical protein [Bacillus sp. JCM 19041]|uniref:hypothetical protein n=1 Tax=Bacillus sp. JCM 19041 TaxID=1460637 RepID=UPI0006D0A00D
MSKQLRIDRVVEASIHARVHPTDAAPVSRITPSLPILGSNHYSSENDLYAYSYAHKRKEKPFSSTNHYSKKTLDVGEWYRMLSTHSRTTSFYNHIREERPDLDQKLSEGISSHSICSQDIKDLSTFLHAFSTKKRFAFIQDIHGLAVDVYV